MANLNTKQKKENLKKDGGKMNLELSQFYGTENYYKAGMFSKAVVTDGIQYLREKANCYWLIDIVTSYESKLRNVPFQIWNITKSEDNSAVITCKEDSDQPELITQKIPYTDFPIESLEFYCIDGVIMLKSEY